ncbi:MAG: hypothetical protein ACM34I_11820 [bacterium]
MSYTCKHCKYGADHSPDGQKPPQGTVWCGKRKMPLGQNRTMSCFVLLVSEKSRRCQDCTWAKLMRPTGGAPELGNIWCERRHSEMNKLRTMECFE